MYNRMNTHTLSFLLLSLLLSNFVLGTLTCPSPQVLKQVSGFAVFTARPEDAAAFTQDLRLLIAPTRKEPGNVKYVMYTNPNEPGVIGFFETYSNLNALQQHLTADHVTSIVASEYSRTVRSKPPALFGPWKEVAIEGCESNDEELEMVFYWTMNCTRQHVWNVITNWEDASWVQHVTKSQVIPLRQDGTPMTDAEAAEHGPVDSKRGLGNVVQRRTYSSGKILDVRMLERNDSEFVTVQEIVTPLVFPDVKFDKFYVTISLHTDGVDESIQTRLRYHVRATVLEGTKQQAREILKGDFYGPRILHYQQLFNCTSGVAIRTAQNGVATLHRALESQNRVADVTALFTNRNSANQYLRTTFGDDELPENAIIRIVTPKNPVVVPDLRAMAVEDVVIETLSGTAVRSRIVLYQMDAWGRVVSTKVYDIPATNCDNAIPTTESTTPSWWTEQLTTATPNHAKCIGKDLIDATSRYFEVLKTRDLAQIRTLYSATPELHDPVGYQPNRTFDSVYQNFVELLDGFEYTRYPARTFVHPQSRQTVQLIDAVFNAESNGLGVFKASPIQVFTFDESLRIQKFEAYFIPRVIDFSNLP